MELEKKKKYSPKVHDIVYKFLTEILAKKWYFADNDIAVGVLWRQLKIN